MAEGVLFNIAERIIVGLGNRALQQIGSIWGVQDEFNKLKDTILGFQAVLLDAEQKQVNNSEVKLWLQRVEDAVYEADDMLDEFNFEVQQRQLKSGNTKLSKVLLFFSSSNQLAFGLKMGNKVKDINKRLSEVASRRPSDLKDNREDTRFIKRERVTHSFVPKENFIGRDEDTKAIIQLLLDPISSENVSTISIVGIGGLGKTALAQLIFNDEVIQNHFELKIWTCVSNVFELDVLVKKILQPKNNDEIEQLQNDLRKKVNGKKYLLVLDDVWNEDREKWLSLKNLLMGGGEGSRILITTRSKNVATISDTAKPYILKGLNEEQSWSLFKKIAYKDGREPKNSTIKAVGKEVTRKCQGVPLAIRTIGGMLFSVDDETEWLNFKEKKLSKINQEENHILPTLKLSYDVLPSHLKHCFAYCSLFPPDYEISVQTLIRSWVAQGFIKSSDENEGLDDLAYEYFKELLQRSFFQEEYTDELGIISCKMHDLMNELAILVSGVGSTVVEPNQKNFHEKLRHVSINFQVDPSEWQVPTSLANAKNIRTFILLHQEYLNDGDESLCDSFCATIVSNFKSLRMLNLNGLKITTLPKCLKKMKHLRYLDLSYNDGIKRLPDWIVGLSNLETLDLSWCRSLVELPRDIKKMINLRHLILFGCGGLNRMPRGIGELKGVRTLNRFVLSESNCSAGLGELGSLKELRGDLVIVELRHVVSKSNVGTPLKDKHHLHSLELWWKNGEDVKAFDEEDIIKSMEVLQPHSNLKKLTVCYYGGVRFASWFSSLINIVHLSLWDCTRCQHLPPLDHFPSLKKLELLSLERLEYISEKESSNSMSDEMMRISFFPSLESLQIYNCPVLKGWWRAHTHNSASSSSSSAENLSLPSFPSLSQLYIFNCPNLTSMPLYPNVVEIELGRSSWKVVDSLFVRGAFDSTDDVGVNVSASSSSPHLSKLSRLSLRGIEDLEFIPSEGIANLTSLQSLTIEDCPKLAALPEGIANLTSLRSLRIEDCPNLAALPEGIANLTSLQSLSIGNFPNWAALPEEISNLTSLRDLQITSCSNLASLPEGIRGLPRLNTLVIENCPMLLQRYKKETGEDWHKIAHIPYVRIG